MADTSEGIESSVKDAETPTAAEAQSTSNELPAVNVEMPSDDSASDCAVCLETMVQPTELPCKHVFCFLCVKGIAQKTRCCALCRREIPLNYFDSPHLLNDPLEKEKGKCCFDDENQPLWYYKGRSGWWQYDDRTGRELENSHSKGESYCEVLIAGYLYVVDFALMTQYRKDDPIRRRSVRRDTQPLSIKGIAGVPLQKQAGSLPDQSNNTRPTKTPNHQSSSSLSYDLNEAGPSCSVFVFNLVPPGTSGMSTQTQKKESQGDCNVSSNKAEDVIIISSEDDDSNAYDDFDSCDNDSDDDDEEKDDSEDEDDDNDDDDDDDDRNSRVIWSIQFAGSKHGSSKRKASDSGESPCNKKPLILTSAEYKTALELMKAEHNHVKKSLKLKHIRSLVDKKTPKETQEQKNQNYIDLQELEKKQLEEPAG